MRLKQVSVFHVFTSVTPGKSMDRLGLAELSEDARMGGTQALSFATAPATLAFFLALVSQKSVA